MKSSEGMFDDSVVYVTRQGSQVRIDSGRVVVWDVDGDDGELASFPVEKLETVNVFGGVNFSTPFLAEANNHGIVLNYFTQQGSYRGSFVPEKNTIAEVRRAQYALPDDRELAIARAMIHAKIRNQRIFLARKDVRETPRLEELEERALEVDDQDDLRGTEGEAAQKYFEHLDETLVDGWTFEKRTRRPPEDHINAVLSLTYVMIKNEVLSALRQYNLDPFLGVFHTDRHGRPSLALDLQEEFRPIFCDAFATRLVNRGTLSHDDFRKDNKLCDTAFKTYLGKFDDYMEEEFRHPHFDYTVTRREAIRQQVILLRKAIVGELDDYHPLRFQR
jgi:CRISPR-associated protein Cas1